ncbi:MAG: CRISPR-associated endoribonuclease Cas6 [Candidatus Thorarchaeota archaeon]
MVESLMEIDTPVLAPKDLLMIEIDAVPMEKGRVNSFTGHLIRGALLRMISNRDPELVSLLHDGKNVRPYSVAPVRMSRRRDQRDLLWEIRPGRRLRFRVCSLARDVSRRIIEGLLTTGWEDLKIGETHLRVVAARFESKSFAELVKDAPPVDSHEFKFISPTKFEIRSETFPMLFPLPPFVFGGLGSLWNRFAPREFHIDMDEFVAGVRTHVCVTQYDLRTVAVRIKGSIPVTGFVGRARFKVAREAPKILLGAVSLLSSFARFSGVGAKRSFGFRAVDTRPIEMTTES